MKTKKILLAIAIVGIAIVACEEILTAEEQGEKASKEFCECYKNKSLSDCEDELNKNYSSYTYNNDFIDAFNNSNTCGAKITGTK